MARKEDPNMANADEHFTVTRTDADGQPPTLEVKQHEPPAQRRARERQVEREGRHEDVLP